MHNTLPLYIYLHLFIKVVIATSQLATVAVPSLIHERDEARRRETEIGAWVSRK